MDMTELANLHKAELVNLLHLWQHVGQGLTRTILLLSTAITGDGVDGAKVTLEAAQMIAGMLLKEAAEKRKAGEIGEAEVRERAVEQFNMLVRETLRPVPPRH
ncbi:hypothetical protein ASE66_12515 [Bosea sp. Root483D1]|uniref:hypothetical protein n=1 Tax=Bosea sp. Root483D1 TaxID=1736544 RepID=UPI00070D4FD1|nr:hypothetical protein [Bosea sp. Root483D1]KRE15662.1 hypothetical protein ASE66_12515 [Bosea sp. Root483D1]